MDGSGEAADEGDGDPPGGGYRWKCPACGETRVNTMSRRGRNALRALKTHVYLREGDGHGDGASYPADDPEGDRLSYVEPVGDSRE